MAEFGEFSDRKDIILSLADYLESAGAVTEKLWRKLEQELVLEGTFKKGGYMNTREYIKEEGRQEGMRKGIQKERRQVVLNMLKEKAEITFICKVTGLSEEEVKQLKNGT